MTVLHRPHAAAARRRWLRALAWPMLAGLQAVAMADDGVSTIDVWVVLTLPELASLPRDAAAERTALQRRIEAQQEQVLVALRALGAVELGRVQLLRNALAVRLPSAKLPAARRIPGVRVVQPVRNVERDPPLPVS